MEVKCLKYFRSHYMDKSLVLIIDLFLSYVAINMSFLLMSWIFKTMETDVLSHISSVEINSVESSTSLLSFLTIALVGLLAWCIANLIFKTHKHIIRYFTYGNIWRIFVSIFIQCAFMGLYMGVVSFFASYSIREIITFSLFYITFSVILILVPRLFMIWAYKWFLLDVKSNELDNYLVVGTSPRSVALMLRMRDSKDYNLSAFISYNPLENNLSLMTVPILYFNNHIEYEKYVKKNDIKGVIYVDHASLIDDSSDILSTSEKLGLNILKAPEMLIGDTSHISSGTLHKISLQDVLNLKSYDNYFCSQLKNKVVMVTGAAGNIGSELCRLLAHFQCRQLILYDNAESPTHNLRLELKKSFPSLSFVPILGDITFGKHLDLVFKKYKPQIVFHAAAYIQTQLMENNPCEAISVNVEGTRRVAEMCINYGTENMIAISSDQADEPSNVLNITKRLSEIVIKKLNESTNSKTRFTISRCHGVSISAKSYTSLCMTKKLYEELISDYKTSFSSKAKHLISSRFKKLEDSILEKYFKDLEFAIKDREECEILTSLKNTLQRL